MLRRVTGAMFLGAALAALAFHVPIRTAEATITSYAIDAVTSGGASSANSIVFFGLGSGVVHGLQITPLCSSIVLAVPLLTITGLLLVASRMHPGRIIGGLARGAGIAIGANLLRYSTAAFALQNWGMTGFDVVHKYVGSMAVIVGFGIGMVVCIKTAASSGEVRHAITV